MPDYIKTHFDAETLLLLLYLFATRNQCSNAEIMHELGISRATFFRLIHTLKNNFGVIVLYSYKFKGYRIKSYGVFQKSKVLSHVKNRGTNALKKKD